MMRWLIILICVLAAGCSGERPKNLGIQNNRLQACPSSPNCVSSFEKVTDQEHYMPPIEGDWSDLVRVLEEQERVSVIEKTDKYIYVEFKSGLWGFVDDVEFLFFREKNLIHFRSASRLGYSDFGVNRKRLKKIGHLLSRTHDDRS